MKRIRPITLALLLSMSAPSGVAAAQVPLSNQDDCANAAIDSVGAGYHEADTRAATTGPQGQNEANCIGFATSAVEGDIWFVFSPTTTGTTTILACGFGPTVGGKVAVYPGVSCPVDGSSIACDGWSCGAQGGGAQVVFPSIVGQDYLVQLGSEAGAPPFVGTVFVVEELGTLYCSPARPNSTGVPGRITASGSGLAAVNDFTLNVASLPQGAFGYCLASRTPGLYQPPASAGPICLAGDIGRFIAPGEILTGAYDSLDVDLTNVPGNPPRAIQPGETWNFQCWYRDAGVGQSTSNFTDAVAVVFQ